MAAHERLERLKVACLRRRDKEAITGFGYHCVAAVRAIVAGMRAPSPSLASLGDTQSQGVRSGREHITNVAQPSSRLARASWPLDGARGRKTISDVHCL